MIDELKRILGIGKRIDFAKLMQEGPIIQDVRSKSEYDGGHIKGSINIPVSELYTKHAKLKDKDKPIVTCCASGIRSANAKNILKSFGFTQVYNGGGWHSLQTQIYS
jgi:rhodanese-related sulfurtransferase